jgi:hypothetical protein
MAQGNPMDVGFFIVMDRLHQTLDQRMKEWVQEDQRSRGFAFGIGKNKLALKQLLVYRMTVAYDLAAAFFYLHENWYVRYIFTSGRCEIGALHVRAHVGSLRFLTSCQNPMSFPTCVHYDRLVYRVRLMLPHASRIAFLICRSDTCCARCITRT